MRILNDVNTAVGFGIVVACSLMRNAVPPPSVFFNLDFYWYEDN